MAHPVFVGLFMYADEWWEKKPPLERPLAVVATADFDTHLLLSAKLHKGNVFTPVYHSVHRGVCVVGDVHGRGACVAQQGHPWPGGGVHGGGWQHTSPTGQTYTRGGLPLPARVCI